MNQFLPVTKADLAERGWEEFDFLVITGDAYVDHPSFGPAIISRVLEAEGYRVAILAQPDWRKAGSFTALGRPRLGVLLSSGNIDSMVAHYTVAKKRRHDDAYSPGNRAGLRPDRAVIVYANKVREAFGDIPLVIGGLEASLRRFAHYDYWEDKVRRAILFDSQADLLVYGMGERATREIAARLASGTPIREITDVKGTTFIAKDPSACAYPKVECPSFEAVSTDKRAYAQANQIQYEEHDPVRGKAILQRHGDRLLVVNPPAMPLTTAELDFVAELPYVREPHPMYDEMGGVPAIEEVRFSVTHNRGCFGACNFCSLAFHQGRTISCRSHESVIREVTALTHHPGFKGYIHDVGGPAATFRRPSCQKQLKHGMCKNRACLAPEACPNLDADHTDYMMLLRKLRAIPGVKKVFIRSGIRFDYVMADPDPDRTFLRELVEHHVSGQLRVAPEHVSDTVLAAMGKPPRAVYDAFCDAFEEINRETGKKQFVVPYLMSSHPGSTLAEAIELAEYVRDMGFNPEQVQDFYPTPSTISTCMYYTGLDPLTMEPIYVPRTPHEKALQRALIQYRNLANYDLVREALVKAGRTDLIGWDEQCLIRPKRPKKRDADGGAPKGKGRGAKERGSFGKGKNAKGRVSSERSRGAVGAASKPQRAGKPPKANGRKGGIRKGR